MKEKYEKILTQEDYEREYQNFDEFCTVFKTLENVMYWYKYNKVKWPDCKLGIDDPNDKYFAWPDDILKTKIGNCWDHAIFFYYFCKKQNIPARMYRFAVYLEPIFDYEYWCEGHVVCICKLVTGYYACDYFTKPESNLYGPFKSFEDCAKSYSVWYKEMILKMLKTTQSEMVIKNHSDTYYSYVDNHDLKIYDKYYNKHDITQLEFDKLTTSTKFKYDYKSIKRDIFDIISNKAIYYIRSIISKIFK